MTSEIPLRRRAPGTVMTPVVGCCLVAAIWAFASVRVSTDNSRWGANYFPNVTLTTQAGRSVRFYDDLIKGKIVAINLIYTSCQYNCPLETARLAQVQKLLGDRMGKDVFFYSIPIDPQHDTPAVLRAYADQFGAGPGWFFLTGNQADIDLLSRKLGLYSPPNPSNKDGHTPSLLIGNEATGQWTQNVATSQPSSLARMIGTWLNGWQNAAATPIKSYADAPPVAPFDLGAYTWAKRCGACHTIGRGGAIAPDLAPVSGSTARRDGEAGIGPVLTAYLTIQRALAADSLAAVKDRAHDILVEAAKGGAAEPPVVAAAKTFERVTDLSSARVAFGKLSEAMLDYAQLRTVCASHRCRRFEMRFGLALIAAAALTLLD